MTLTEYVAARTRHWADIAWAARPHWWDALYATAGVAIFLALHAALPLALALAAVVLIGGPWVDILLTWLLHLRRSTETPADQPGGPE